MALPEVPLTRKIEVLNNIRATRKVRLLNLEIAMKRAAARLNMSEIWTEVLKLPCEQLVDEKLAKVANSLRDGTLDVRLPNVPYRIVASTRTEASEQALDDALPSTKAPDERDSEVAETTTLPPEGESPDGVVDTHTRVDKMEIFVLRIKIFLLMLGITDFYSAMTRFWLEATLPATFIDSMDELILAMCNCQALSPTLAGLQHSMPAMFCTVYARTRSDSGTSQEAADLMRPKTEQGKEFCWPCGASLPPEVESDQPSWRDRARRPRREDLAQIISEDTMAWIDAAVPDLAYWTIAQPYLGKHQFFWQSLEVPVSGCAEEIAFAEYVPSFGLWDTTNAVGRISNYCRTHEDTSNLAQVDFHFITLDSRFAIGKIASLVDRAKATSDRPLTDEEAYDEIHKYCETHAVAMCLVCRLVLSSFAWKWPTQMANLNIWHHSRTTGQWEIVELFDKGELYTYLENVRKEQKPEDWRAQIARAAKSAKDALTGVERAAREAMKAQHQQHREEVRQKKVAEMQKKKRRA
ncbi:hypothetical protein CALVIDRAFT_525288 [Calocera viscosa TUFC12733]|uniref:Uncharacterized protein n=1 Tax=Calocera viscosa (strain TUFC12733) TaxID=1330018 RepID=A0A167QGV9_CALVF|nr:hypothetical protein CALVIDRAFT_525288 [Calocera viscosa TUFC12733]